MKFLSRYLIMNTNLNKKTISFNTLNEFTVAQTVYTSRLSAQRTRSWPPCAPMNRYIQMYRCGSVHVSCFHLQFSTCMLWWCLRWISHVSENEGLGSLESEKTMEKYFIIIFKNVKKKWIMNHIISQHLFFL